MHPIVFVINLDSRPDRWENVSNQTNHHSLTGIIRISATETPEFEDYLTTRPVAACWESHHKALKEFLKSPSEYALILEDDFRIDERNIEKVIDDALESGLDFIQLGFLRTTFKESVYIFIENLYDRSVRLYGYLERIFASTSDSKKELVRERIGLTSKFVISDIRPGAHAYLVNKKAARHLVQLNKPVFLSTDDLYMALGSMRIIRMARLRKSSIGQIKSTSSINPR